MICNNGHLVGLIDFEEVCFDNILFDVAITIIGCCYQNQKLNKNYLMAFLRAYNEKHPFTDEEKSLFGNFVAYACISLAFWRFRQFNLILPHNKAKNSYSEISNIIPQWVGKEMPIL